MNNYSFKHFYENKMMQEVGQHVFPDNPKDYLDKGDEIGAMSHGKPYAFGSTEKRPQSRQGESGNFWFDKKNPLGGETTPVFVTKDRDHGIIEVDFTSEMKGQLATYMTREVPFSDTRDNSLRNSEKILKSFIKAAGQIILDHGHSGRAGIGGQPRYIMFKPAFDYLRNQEEIQKYSGKKNYGINLPLTLLEKGLNLAAKEAEKKFNSLYDQTPTDVQPTGKDWDKLVTIECRGSTCKIYSKHMGNGYNKHRADLDVWDNSKEMIRKAESDKVEKLKRRQEIKTK